MRACEIARLQRATEAMEAAYQRLSARLDARGQAKLRAAQQSWLRFRAAEADYQADVATDGTLAPLVAASVARGAYADALKALASVRTAVDLFFDKVMVNVDDSAVRANRLGLLKALFDQLNAVADISKLGV